MCVCGVGMCVWCVYVCVYVYGVCMCVCAEVVCVCVCVCVWCVCMCVYVVCVYMCVCVCVVSVTLQPLYLRERTPVPSNWKLLEPREHVWTFRRIENLLLLPVFEPRTFLPIASRYTKYDISATANSRKKIIVWLRIFCQ